MTVLNGTSLKDTFNITPQIWTNGVVTGHQDYTITNFTFGVDVITLPFAGGTASFSTVEQFKQALLDIEATGLKGWSAIGTDYSIDGADVVFSWNGQGNIRLVNAAPTLDLGDSILVGVQGTDRADHITVSYNADLTNVINSGFGDDTVVGGQWDDWLSNQGGNDVVTLGSGNDGFNGADDANGSDRVYGDGGNDQIWTYGGDDFIFGGTGDDTVYAGAGDDTIDLGDGSDFLNGLLGNDTVSGGLGRDIYTIGKDAVDPNGVLTITDLTLQNGTIGGSGEDILSLWINGYEVRIDNRNDLAGLNARADTTITKVDGDLIIDNTWFGTIVADNCAFMF